MKHPSEKINCLLIYPKFPKFPQYTEESLHYLYNTKAQVPPIGLMTVAALLPQHWEFKLIDLNCTTLEKADFEWADIVMTGGMFTQIHSVREISALTKKYGKPIVIGGPDITAQPYLYEDADVKILGEAEVTLPIWLDSWKSGKIHGTFQSDDKANLEKTVIPRFDLIDHNLYYQASVQYARGCPFNCEFCDIVEIYGRNPRVKTANQVISELQSIYDSGYRGRVYFVDDNFIGNLNKVRNELLPALIDWQIKNKYPFYFYCYLTANASNYPTLMDQLQKANFEQVFIGIESPDPETLKSIGKIQNVSRPLAETLWQFNKRGISILGAFISGFDTDNDQTVDNVVTFINENAIVDTSMSILIALPKSRLTKKLVAEKRLFDITGPLYEGPADKYKFDAVEAEKNWLVFLNFLPFRPRVTIYREIADLQMKLYDPKNFIRRVRNQMQRLSAAKPIPMKLWRANQQNWQIVFRFLILLFTNKDIRFFDKLWVLKTLLISPSTTFRLIGSMDSVFDWLNNRYVVAQLFIKAADQLDTLPDHHYLKLTADKYRFKKHPEGDVEIVKLPKEKSFETQL